MLKITRQQLDTLAHSELGGPARSAQGSPTADGKDRHAQLIAPCPEPPPRKRIIGFSG